MTVMSVQACSMRMAVVCLVSAVAVFSGTCVAGGLRYRKTDPFLGVLRKRQRGGGSWAAKVAVPLKGWSWQSRHDN
jgi:hypothetical protein